MQSLLNKKYVIFPIIMIILLFINTFVGFHFSGINEVLDKYDITGKTKIYLYIMFAIELLILVFCTYKGIKGLSKGYDYFFSKIICIVFIILFIISTSSFFLVRNEEEKQAEELKNKTQTSIENMLKPQNKSASKKSMKKSKGDKLQEYLDIQNTDDYYNRKQDILNEKESKNAFLDYFLFNRYNYNITYRSYLTMEERYYAIFSRGAVINIICAIVYLISACSDTIMNRKRNNK